MSYDPDLTELETMESALEAIAKRVSDRLQQHHQQGFTLTLKLKYADYRQITRSVTQAEPWCRSLEICQTACRLLRQHLEPNAAVRLLGITLANLQDVGQPSQTAVDAAAKSFAEIAASERFQQLSLSYEMDESGD